MSNIKCNPICVYFICQYLVSKWERDETQANLIMLKAEIYLADDR